MDLNPDRLRGTFDGAPVGLQIMGRRLEEEKVIGMMKVIAEALQEYEGKAQTCTCSEGHVSRLT
jgi:Asp-tRNA(Asn)/Glu-tRNA(Gln) amidotransferase A subunit family amidase